MKRVKWTNVRRMNVALHRDLGYFFSVLIIIYCLSGIALNHADDWNSDFIITKTDLRVNVSDSLVNRLLLERLSNMVGERSYKVFDVPAQGQVKIYYDNASFHVNFRSGRGLYEQVARRPLFYQANLIHRNSVRGWKWAADVFAVCLIVISVSGVFIMKGKYGISGRGKWFMMAGCLPLLIVFLVHYFW